MHFCQPIGVPTLGFIGQIKGILTIKQYKAATVFVDHFSQLTFVFLQLSTGAEETVKAKKAFEAYAQLHGATVLSLPCQQWQVC
jgi:hypothetical protein